MNQAEVTKLMSALKIAVAPKARRLRNIDGPQGRLEKLRKTVTAIIKHERIELNFNRADEARGYVERVSQTDACGRQLWSWNFRLQLKPNLIFLWWGYV